MSRRVILDVDTGTDDAVALMLALLAPGIELLGVSTVTGNCPVEMATENTLRVMDYLRQTVPVFMGMTGPMLRPPPAEIWGGYLNLPPARQAARPQHAVDWLRSTLRASDGDITVVALAPLTNLAMALKLDPGIVPKIGEIVVMGGGHAVRNMTPAAEFNISCDPEAANVVLGAGCPTRLITLDATHSCMLHAADACRLRACGSPAALLTAGIIEDRMCCEDHTWGRPDEPVALLHDALAVASVIDPAVVETRFVHVAVETAGTLSVGSTVIDLYGRSGLPANVSVAMTANARRFVDLLVEILSREPPAKS